MAKLVHNVQKKQHRERAQPSERRKLGLLEKKKDYKLRAKDRHAKEAYLKLLREKAKNRNPDEYYHAMVNRTTNEDGIMLEKEEEPALTEEEIYLVKTQNATYVSAMRNRDLGKIRRMKQALSYGSEGKHTVFVDNETELETFDPVKFFKTDARLLNQRENRLKVDQLLDGDLKNYDQVFEKTKLDTDAEKLKQLKLLKSHMDRAKKLQELHNEIVISKELTKEGEKEKLIGSDGKPYYKWKTQRKR
ncbi:Small subunit (SSU) processome component [Komagataella phaffii CBS 7435]|uniref:U3 small nucleolar RNA-associated protein 11 n=2 Tax=Komagataella phaffii TaxID=460519 RepID=C4QZ29_KOMPG|nr:U3 small nucleolar RNA-associated protein [Komagataella phaffii GS115]AOA60904.1 GQ67_01494T0 [Komagataella phaffii]CAH2447331.1 Small subunit (SSU) processome component [Komagataella phaffii CBS 7435]AOA65598.1 GQ68_01510T0 [Komagataella phaffii GS115]CAY68503.1 U3 small nucleolar RNA-associated protein [Komagataella phaffii GS115]CCA37567.1 Small subunit (SSU) processome component [Komagataella phaffii CBS 7435]